MHDALPDGALLERARGGDRGAFDALVRRHYLAIYRMLHRLAGNHEDAEDLAQECFVRAWGARAAWDERAPVPAWLRRIALHLARDHHRARGRRRPRATLDEPAPEPLARQPDAELSQRELSRWVASALERLPERLRTALVLRVFEGQGYDDIGRATGVTPATARTHVMQARKRLGRWLAPWIGPRREGGPR